MRNKIAENDVVIVKSKVIPGAKPTYLKPEERTGTVYWIHKGRACVILVNGLMWYGELDEIYLHAYSRIRKVEDNDFDDGIEVDYLTMEKKKKVEEESYRVIPEEEYLQYGT